MLRKLNPRIFRQSGTLSEFEAYKDLDTLPIWNWFQFHKKNEWKYLLKLSDYSQKVSINSDLQRYLAVIYDDLICQFDELDLEVLRAKRDYQIQLYSFITEIAKNGNIFTDFQEMDSAFKILLKLAQYDDPDAEWIFKLPIRKPELRRFLTEVAKALVEYQKLKSISKPEQDLLDKIVRINSELGVNIDEKTCSVKKFMAYQKAFIEQVNAKNKTLQ